MEKDAATTNIRLENDSIKYGRFLANPSNGEKVVISGLSGTFPESNNVSEFAENLYNKVDMLTDDTRRWEITHPAIPKRSGKVPLIEKFDAGFFGVSYKRSTSSDPTRRKTLEIVTEAIFDAGLSLSDLEGTNTGVFLGTSHLESNTYWSFQNPKPNHDIIVGCLKSTMVHEISYFLKLKGPSIILDTACSSSLHALEHAYKAIRNQECDTAIVVGCNLCLQPYYTVQFFNLGVLSLDGFSRPFDVDGQGYVRSELMAACILQKSKDAKRIYCTVVHTKTNCDGFKDSGITYPSGDMQIQLLEELYTECQVKPTDVSFFEAHSTGTKAGDPEELRAIEDVFLPDRRRNLLIGSLKSNIGHTEPGSGLGSVIKSIIAMETGYIPPNIHYNKPRLESKALVEGKLQVVTTKKQFEDRNGLIAINNFGFGGANGHILLKHNTKHKDSLATLKGDYSRIVCVSGRTEEAVHILLDSIIKAKDIEHMRLLQDVFRKSIRGHSYRGFILLNRHGEISRSSKLIKMKKKHVYIAVGEISSTKTLFNEMMQFPVFADTINRIQDILSKKNVDIKRISTANGNSSFIDRSLASIFTQIGIMEVLKSIKFQPTGFFGNYSVPILGKTVCDYYDGTLTLKETVEFVHFTLMAESKTNQEHSNGHYSTTEDLVEDLIYNKLSHKTGTRFLQMKDHLSTIKVIQPKYIEILQIGNLSTETTYKLLRKKISILNVSDGINDLLTAVGRIYEAGHDLDLFKLFPPVEFPVSRGTPMISPDIKWIHNRDWFVVRYSLLASDGQRFGVSLEEQDWTFSSGHVIDGRTLFPATGYLSLAWDTLAAKHKLDKDAMKVVFENCKFKRACSFTNKGVRLEFTVAVQSGTGNFEVQESDSVVVTGKIYVPKEFEVNHFTLPLSRSAMSNEISLTTKNIYKELRLRGYFYSGECKGLVEYDINNRIGKIKWNNNWVTFMDNMLQTEILNLDTRLLYVPISIQRVYIDSTYHKEMAEKYTNNIMPTYVYTDAKVIRSAGIEIRCLRASEIPRKKYNADPVLEEYTFVPNDVTLNLTNSLRVIAQLLMENAYGIKVKSVEIIDEVVKENSHPLSPLLHEVLLDIPLIKPDMTVLSQKQLKFDNVKCENRTIFIESECSLVIGTKLLQRSTVFKAALNSLKTNGFVLSRENLDVDLEWVGNNITVLAVHTVQNEKLVLLRKSKIEEHHIVIKISSTDKSFSWLPQLQTAVKNEANVILYAQDDPLNGIIGLVNCVRTEAGSANVKAFFMLSKAPDFDTSNAFFANQIDKNMSINVFKDEVWGTYRHLSMEIAKEKPAEHCYVNATNRGDLSSIRWIQGRLRSDMKVNCNETLVHIYYAALNFRDVMLASGKITTDVIIKERISQECVQGLEFSGRTKDGRRVMGLVQSGASATLVVADKYLVWDVPDHWTLEDAATVPVVYSTCLYAFLKRANLKPGESVLIHSGTGGVGQAAITLALAWGCIVYVTVGTKEKRDYLLNRFPKLTERNIGNSRDNSFEAFVMKETSGRGVDVVLNSLAEEKLLASVRCLARGGRFLEIGKYDLGIDNPLNLLLLQKEAKFYGIMADVLFAGDTARKFELFNLLRNAVASCIVKPLPRTVFKDDEFEKAFRFMSLGKHTGKIVVKIREEENDKISVPAVTMHSGLPRYFCDKEQVYIICGGLGGFGLELADWLVLRGCRKLVLTSRSGVTDGYQLYRIKIWRSYGCSVRISKQINSTILETEELINEAKELGAVAAVFNLAVVLQDSLIEDQTLNSFETSFKPKAYATQYLDEVTRKRCPKLKDFVVFSSVTCGRGNASQTNYGMANSVMERICEERRKDGIPALAIQWGAVADVGIVAEMQENNIELEISGTFQQRIASCLEVMDIFLTQKKATIVSSMVVAEKKTGSMGGDALSAVANILGADLKSISFQSTLAEVGMDSMSAVEIKQTLEREFDILLTAQNIKNLTFFRLKEMQADKEADQQKINKTDCCSTQLELKIKLLGDEELDNIPALKLNSNSSQNLPKVFLLPGIEGTVAILQDLATSFKAEIIGLQYCYNNPKSSIEDMAMLLLPLIEKETRNSEPLNLVAYSFGTVIAVEVLRLLENKGYRGTLINIDGAPKFFKHVVDVMFCVSNEKEFQTRLLLHMISMEISSNIVPKHVDALRKCKNLDERINLAVEIVGKNLSRSPEKSRMFAYSVYLRIKAAVAYEPKHKIKSKVVLFKPTEIGVKMEAEEYGLSSICEYPVQINIYEGNHLTILENPGVADEINQILLNSLKSH